MFISPFRRLTSIGTLTVLVVVIGGVWYAASPKRISRMAEGLLSNVLGGKVTVKTGHLSLSGTLLLSGVEVRTEGGADALPIFSADQLEARFDWISLLAGELRATQLTAIRPTLYLVEDRGTDHWNYETFKRQGASTRPGAGGGSGRVPLPVIILRDARVQWGEFERGRLTVTANAEIDGQLTPTPASLSTYRFQLTQRGGEGEQVGPLGGSEVSVTGTWDVANNHFTAATQEVVLSDALKNVLPRQVRSWWDEHHLRGRFSKLNVDFDNEGGLVVGADLDQVSMEMHVTPSARSTTYGVNVSDVRGSLTFGINKMSVAAHLNGRLLGYDFRADGEVDGAQPDSPLDLRVEFPGAVLGEDYPPLFMAFPGSQDLLQRVAPHGKFDVSVVAARKAGTRDLVLDGNIYCDDARMRFGPFPFPLEHVKGHVAFNQNTVTFDDVLAYAGENLVHLKGSTGTTPANTTIDFLVWSDDAVFDDRLGACLPEQYKAIWDQFVLKVHAKFKCLVQRQNGQRGAPNLRVDLDVLDASGYAKMLPYRFSNAHGQLVLTPDQTEVKGIQVKCGADGSGSAKFDGVIYHPGGDVSNLMPNLRVDASVPMDVSLLNAIPEEYTEKLKDVALAGRLGFDGTVRRGAASGGKGKRLHAAPLDIGGTVTWRDGSVKTHDGAVDLKQVAVTAEMAGDGLEIQDARATILDKLQLTARGAVDFEHGSAHLNIGAHGADVVIPADAPGMLPTEMRSFWMAYKPTGKIDVDGAATVHLSNGDLGVDGYLCTLTPKGISVTNASWPAAVHDIGGRIDVSAGRVVLHQLTAQTGPVALTCDGVYHTDTGACNFQGSATSDGLPGEWTAKLPESMAKFLVEHKTAGQLRLSVDDLQRETSDKPWNFDVELAARSLTMTSTPDINAERISLGAKGTCKGSVIDFSGMLSGTNVGISGKTLDTLQAGVSMLSSEQKLKISDIDAKVAGGAVHGSMEMQFGGAGQESAGQCEANLVLADAELNRLMLPPTATDEERKRVGDGRVWATLAMRQTFGDHPDRTGRGDMAIRDGKIYNVPLAMGLMQMVTLRLPVSQAFNHAAMSYYLRDNKVTFEKILLESPSIDLAGAGTMSLKDKSLDLNFVTESPNELSLPLVSTIINQIRLELLQLSVTGTIDDPKITPVPLSPLATSLRALLPHPAANGE